MRCYSCGEYDGITLHHNHDRHDDCSDESSCHSYCPNCDNGLCAECES